MRMIFHWMNGKTAEPLWIHAIGVRIIYSLIDSQKRRRNWNDKNNRCANKALSAKYSCIDYIMGQNLNVNKISRVVWQRYPRVTECGRAREQKRKIMRVDSMEKMINRKAPTITMTMPKRRQTEKNIVFAYIRKKKLTMVFIKKFS